MRLAFAYNATAERPTITLTPATTGGRGGFVDPSRPDDPRLLRTVISGRTPRRGDGRVISGILRNARLNAPNSQFRTSGATIEKTGERTYRLEDAVFTTCLCEDDSCTEPWRIRAKRAELVVDGYGTVEDARFEVLGVPVPTSGTKCLRPRAGLAAARDVVRGHRRGAGAGGQRLPWLQSLRSCAPGELCGLLSRIVPAAAPLQIPESPFPPVFPVLPKQSPPRPLRNMRPKGRIFLERRFEESEQIPCFL